MKPELIALSAAVAMLMVITGILAFRPEHTVMKTHTVTRIVHQTTIDRQARVSNLGVCVIGDPDTGDVEYVTQPLLSGTAVSCEQGIFIPITPGRNPQQ
jgi:hypothetical protein